MNQEEIKLSDILIEGAVLTARQLSIEEVEKMVRETEQRKDEILKLKKIKQSDLEQIITI